MTDADPLAALRDQRTALADRLNGLHGQVAKLNAAANGQAEAQTALDQLGRDELAAMEAWLASGSGGEPAPQPNMTKRSALLQALGSAIQQTTTIRAAADGIEAEIDAANNDLAAINEQIESAALDAVAAQFEVELNGLIAFANEAQSRVAAVYGAVKFLGGEADQYQRAGDTTKVIAIRRRLERMAGLPKPEWLASVAETQAAAPAWQARYAELVK